MSLKLYYDPYDINCFRGEPTTNLFPAAYPNNNADFLFRLHHLTEEYGHQEVYKLRQYKDIIIQAMLIVVLHFLHMEL